MQQKINGPVAIAIVVVIVVLLFAGLYKKYMYQPQYSYKDAAAALRAAGAAAHPQGGAAGAPH